MSNPFDNCSTDYARYRPEYPDALFDYLVESSGADDSSLILDVGAGTAKSTIPLLRRGIPVVALEPSHAMIAQGVESYRTLKYVCCIAEQLPIRDRCVDLVTCGQAFHWFERPLAMPEFSRVLRGDGYLAAYWNDRIESEFTAVLEDLISAFNPRFDRGYRKKDWVQRIEDTGTFRVIDQKDFPFTVSMTNDGWIGMVRSFGYVRAIEPSRLPEFERALARELAHHNPPECGYVAQCWLANRA